MAGEVVLFVGGPRDKWAQYLDSVQADIASTEYFGKDYGYKPTGRQIEHKFYDKKTEHVVLAQIWEWTGSP